MNLYLEKPQFPNQFHNQVLSEDKHIGVVGPLNRDGDKPFTHALRRSRY